MRSLLKCTLTIASMSHNIHLRREDYDNIMENLKENGLKDGYAELLYVAQRSLDIPPKFGNRQQLVYTTGQELPSL